MHITKKHWIAAGTGFLIAVIAASGYLYFKEKNSESLKPSPESQTPESQSVVSTTTESTAPAVTKVVFSEFPINKADHIASWSFKGAYTGNDELVAKANADLKNLTNLLGKGTYDDYDIYIGMANDYDLMGDGTNAYQNYNHAISIHPDKGLAYANLGHLMDELGAYHTAADAYAKAVAVEPSVAQYQNAQRDFLSVRFPEEAARLKAPQ